MDRAGSALNRRMGTEVEVILKWMSNIILNQGARKGVIVAVSSGIVSLLGEEADVMTLSANSNGPLDL
jgi:hypothetical protein